MSRRFLTFIIFLALAFCGQFRAGAEEYLFDTTIDASQQFPFADVNHLCWPAPPMYFGGSKTVYFDRLSGRVRYDSVADTMRLTGNVSLKGASDAITFKVYETNTVNVSFNISDGEVPFDSGVMSGSLAGFALPINVTGVWDLRTGEADYTGAFEFQYALALDVFRLSNNTDQFSFGLFSSRGGLFGGVTVADFTAENGFRMVLQNTHPADGVAYVRWDEHILAVVPEPTSISLFVLAAAQISVCGVLRKRRDDLLCLK